MDPLRHGSFEIRLAETKAELNAVKSLRYRVFYEEMGAKPTLAMRLSRRDFDAFDAICDHLMVIDRSRSGGRPHVVGTYRLLRRTVAERTHGFYSEGEFDLNPLWNRAGEIMELGRSCVHPAYRSSAAMPLLWRGIARYVIDHDIDLMFGCGSLPGTDPHAVAPLLAYLHRNHLAPPDLRVQALGHDRVDAGLWADIHAPAETLVELPPLVKGYIRLGGWIGEGAVIDRQFNTIDVCVLVQTERIARKYQSHYLQTAGTPAELGAAVPCVAA